MATKRTSTPTPALRRVADDPKVQQLLADQAEYQAALPEATARVAEAEAAVVAAEEALRATERRVMLGRATDSDLAAVQSRLLDAKRDHATAVQTRDDLERKLALMPEVLACARAAARAEVAATLRADYGKSLAALKAALLTARQASDDVKAVYEEAEQEFPMFDLHPRFRCGMADLGEAGVTPRAARLLDLGWPELTSAYDRHNPSRLDRWMDEADALLARLPKMAAEDKEQGERLEESVARQTRRGAA